jgi:H+/Cl- antiporter ClcA
VDFLLLPGTLKFKTKKTMPEQKNTDIDNGLPIAPSMDVALASLLVPITEKTISRRLVTIVGLSILIGLIIGVVAKAFLSLIALISNFAFFGRFSLVLEPITTQHVGLWVLVIPVVGALIIGLMARFGSSAIRGHGIPEMMEKVLYHHSKISPRLLFFKPVSAAIAIGTGGPFGAEGPIIATGGALGSMLGTFLRTTADERKVLLAAGAAAGMAATFDAPVSAVLLSIELLLFEYRARSIIPVAFAAVAATAVRLLIMGKGPIFPMATIIDPDPSALVFYVVMGALIGLASVLITKAIYAIEDVFERLPIHWMWWPALGAIVVGIVGYFEPRALGVGYDQITQILSGNLVGWSLVALVVFKLIAWSIYLGSGTSGGTLAPLFIIGGGLGALMGLFGVAVAPMLGISVPVAGLVGMAAMFAGASHALMASIVFAFEVTHQPMGILPLLAGCSAAYLVSVLLMRTSIMTEKLARRGAVVPTDYAVDYLSQLRVHEVMTRDLVTFSGKEAVGAIRERLFQNSPAVSHQGFPVFDEAGQLLGVVTLRDILDPKVTSGMLVLDLIKRPPVVTHQDNTLREAADHMVREGVGRLPVVDRNSGKVIGIVSCSDLLKAHKRRLDCN